MTRKISNMNNLQLLLSSRFWTIKDLYAEVILIMCHTLLSNYLELENYTISYTVDDMGDYFLIETRLKNDRYKLNITFYLELDKEKNVIKKVE